MFAAGVAMQSAIESRLSVKDGRDPMGIGSGKAA
jgi:hypothetical protein